MPHSDRRPYSPPDEIFSRSASLSVQVPTILTRAVQIGSEFQTLDSGLWTPNAGSVLVKLGVI